MLILLLMPSPRGASAAFLMRQARSSPAPCLLFQLRFEFFYSLEKLPKSPHPRQLHFRFFQRHGWGRPPNSAVEILRNPSLRADQRAVGDLNVPNNSRLASNHHSFANPDAPGNPGLRRNHGVFSDHNVVGHLHQIINLRARLNPGPTEARPIDRRVRADLHVIVDLDNSDLRHFLLTLRRHFETESVCTNHGAAVQNHSRPEPAAFPNCYSRINHAAVTDNDVVPDVTPGADDR